MQHNIFPSVSPKLEDAAQNATLDELHQFCGRFCSEFAGLGSTGSSHGSAGKERPSQLVIWLTGLSFITVIGLCAVVGILVMRCLKKSVFNRFITFFVSVGVGSLSGSAMFHLLPQAFELANEHSHGGAVDAPPDHGYLNKSFAAIVGIYLFFFTDKVIKIVIEQRKRGKRAKAISSSNHATHKHELGPADGGGGVHSKENGQPAAAAVTDALLLKQTQLQEEGGGGEQDSKRERDAVVTVSDPEQDSHHHQHEHERNGASAAERSINQQTHALCVHDHEYKEGDSVIATVAWMIIFGDGLHNFIDGVTIGASFSESLLSGISVSVAVLCEEFPHELGDVAILVNAGMSMKQALVYNLLSALTCYIGFVIGVLVGNIDETFASYTFGFAGGMFLYISIGCMMPEMKNAMEKGLHVSLKQGLEVMGLQASGVITGLVCMFVMARYGESIRF